MPLAFYSDGPLVSSPTRAQVEQNMKLLRTQGVCSHPCILSRVPSPLSGNEVLGSKTQDSFGPCFMVWWFRGGGGGG